MLVCSVKLFSRPTYRISLYYLIKTAKRRARSKHFFHERSWARQGSSYLAKPGRSGDAGPDVGQMEHSIPEESVVRTRILLGTLRAHRQVYGTDIRTGVSLVEGKGGNGFVLLAIEGLASTTSTVLPRKSRPSLLSDWGRALSLCSIGIKFYR
jgi:hypothetical protein